jgi:hypothetical protein
MIAVSVVGHSSRQTTAELLAQFVPAAEQSLEVLEWPLLGYDVADQSFMSGLMNCGLAEPGRSSMAHAWALRVNERHLFFDVADAFAFALELDSRVPEHAPFFVFAVRQEPGAP